MTSCMRVLVTLCLVFALTLVLGLLPSIDAATPEDFGFGSLKANNQPLQGKFPLLVVVYELSTANSTRVPLAANLTTDMDRLIFNFFATPSVSGYFLENSRTSFSWERAAVLGPVSFTAAETTTLYSQASDDDGDGTKETGLDAAAGFGYLLGVVEAKTGYNFAQWDANGDGQITQDELSIIVIGNNSPNGTSRAGANRPIGGQGLNWSVPGQNVTVQSKVASLDHLSSFMTIAHELSHSFGTTDLYGPTNFSRGLTLMTATIYATDSDRRTYHLDPWHKMRLGWLRPRVFTLGTGGVATISASQIISDNTPILLYDPAKGFNEYFIVEFRSNQVSGGFDHDANVTDPGAPTASTAAASGMAVWHVDLNLPNSLTYHEGAPTRIQGGSTLWNQSTPRLSWTDGTVLPTFLNPIATINGGRELVVEWVTSSDTWIDFKFGGVETGSFAQPFRTAAKAAAAASHGGTLKFKTSGASPETMTLNKRLDLVAVGGPVTLGR